MPENNQDSQNTSSGAHNVQQNNEQPPQDESNNTQSSEGQESLDRNPNVPGQQAHEDSNAQQTVNQTGTVPAGDVPTDTDTAKPGVGGADSNNR